MSSRPARALMVQGTSSWAGKSLVATALCRHFARRGVRVAPFKAQNMSNNARVVAGGEIGVAQYLQALAAGVEPDVRMNPVLVKPEGMTRSQVVLRGVADRRIGALPWRERAPHLRPAVEESLASLREEFELLVIEGAGSPAEINLADSDLANLGAARAANARVLLVADIDRGGAFAHLYGTWSLLEPEDRARIAGFVLNKFRGDADLLAPAPERLRELTGVPVVGVVPWLEHGLPDEDGAAPPPPAAEHLPTVAAVRYPFASNLDELKLAEQVAAVRWARRPADLAGAELVVLPGSKHVAADLAWLRERGLEEPIAAQAGRGGRVLGICGGLQMLGEELEDGERGAVPGLGLLPLRTIYAEEKLARRVELTFAPDLDGVWAGLAGLGFRGYEIRHGVTAEGDPEVFLFRDMSGKGTPIQALPDGRGWARGAVLGIAAHGLLEEPAALEALFGRRPEHSLDATLDQLADEVMAAIDPAAVEDLVDV
ncbi:MAG TPA: cobyric acid synthase [Solirubrobacterales bacterium]